MSPCKQRAGRNAALAALTALLSICHAGQPRVPDWNQWRGPGRDGKLAGFVPPDAWPENLRPKWTREVGIGHSSPLIDGGLVYVFTREGDEEVTRALDLKLGEEKWASRYKAPYDMNPAARAHGKGPKSTPLLADERIYTLGISGILTCLSAEKGNLIWRLDSANQFKATSPLYGTAMSPLMDRGTLYVHLGGHDDGALLALDPLNGKEKWKWTGDGPGYSSPIIVDLQGVRQLVTQTQKLCAGLDANSGKLLWSIPFTTPFDQNCITPVAIGSRIVFGGINQPTAAVEVKRVGERWTAERVWESRDGSLYMSTPVVDGKRLYGMSNRRGGQLYILDAVSGKTVWLGEGRTGDNAAIVDAGRDLLVETTTGDLLVLRKQPDKLEEVRRYRVADSPTWATPAIRGRLIAVKDEARVAVWEIPGK